MNRRNFLRNAGWVSTGFIFVPRLIRAQTVLTADGLAAFKKKVSGGGGGPVSWALVAHGFVQGTGTSGSATTSAFSTIGANLVLCVANWGGGGPASGTATGGDTVLKSSNLAVSNPKVQFFWVINPTQSASYAVTISVVSFAASVNIHAYSFNKTGGTPAVDTEAAGGGTGNWQASTISPGSTTPATSSDLYFAGASWDNVGSTTSATVGSGFTQSPDGNLISFYGLNSAYKIKSDGTAENPGWTGSPTSNADANCNAICFQ